MIVNPITHGATQRIISNCDNNITKQILRKSPNLWVSFLLVSGLTRGLGGHLLAAVRGRDEPWDLGALVGPRQRCARVFLISELD